LRTPLASSARPTAGLAAALGTALRTGSGLLVLPAALLLYCGLALLLVCLGAGPARLQRCYVSFARLALFVGGIRLEARGAESVPGDRAFVVVLNHESGLDPLCLLASLPRLALRFVVKEPVMRIPLLGHALRRTGNMTVVRTDTRGDIERIRRGMDRRAPEVSVVFFAEGTRSRDGALHAFKLGPFATALAHSLAILPVAIAGTFRICPKGGLRLRSGRVALEVGAPISVAGLGFDARERLRDQTHAAVAALRREARRRLREAGEEPGGRD
jgi:1-acyl-sn-glycerol-3-phosphate acyltransferase